ncbi:MAG: rhomboid family intramembrane serine protease, partial [Candidatus Cloacimonetes bacterium]|nr:rhomboid family intramembrane serine protease [Candidatus Cloacimonadota bacterium]
MRLDQAGRGYVELEPYGTIRPMVRNLLIFTVGAFFFIRVLGIEGWLALSAREAFFGGRIWELLTYGFVHANFLHLFFNMFGLWMFGSQLERFWGGRNLLVYYLSCIVGAGLVHVAVG